MKPLIALGSGCHAVRFRVDDVERPLQTVEVSGLVVLLELNDVTSLVLDRGFQRRHDESHVDHHRSSSLALCSGAKPLEPDRQALWVRPPQLFGRCFDRDPVKPLEHVQHRAVIIVEQPARDVDPEVW
jgi:hypothetical protein